VLRRHCDTAGTDFDRIERTCAFAFAPDNGGPACTELIKQLAWLASLGIDTVIGRIDGLEQRTPIELMARHVIPAVTDLQRQTP
jgi:hypothetical protein